MTSLPLSEDAIQRILEEAEQGHSAAQYYFHSDQTATMHPSGSEPKLHDPAFADAELVQLHLLMQERARRQRESLKLYQPLPFQAAFHVSDAPERSIRGSNRAGKTLSAGVEFARAVTNTDPHRKYPSSGRAVIVGRDEKHCGEVLFRKLFKPGAFRVIRDEVTRKWRTYDPKTDHLRRKESRPAPPLIPGRFYSPSDVSWSKKREEIPRKVKLNTGWEIYFFSSLGVAPQGWDVDIVWFDEEIEHPSWYTEMAARLIDRSDYDEAQERWIGGKFLWSATPQAGTIRLFEIHKKAEEERGTPKPKVEEFHSTIFDNKYLSGRAIQAFCEKLEGNDDELRIRVYGEFALLGMRVYSELAFKGVHGCESFAIPDDWTRYICVDPGRQVCAILFAAVPPPTDPRHRQVFLYDEAYIKRCSADRFAEVLVHKIGQSVIYEALIDHHAGRITEMGSGETVEEQYRRALVKQKVKFAKSNSAIFTWASDDIDGGIEAVRAGLHVRNGKARWQVMHDRLPHLIHEAEQYAYKKDAKTGLVTDRPLQINNHLMDDWRYLALHNLKWHRPVAKVAKKGNYAFQYLEEKRKKKGVGSDGRRSIRVG